MWKELQATMDELLEAGSQARKLHQTRRGSHPSLARETWQQVCVFLLYEYNSTYLSQKLKLLYMLTDHLFNADGL